MDGDKGIGPEKEQLTEKRSPSIKLIILVSCLIIIAIAAGFYIRKSISKGYTFTQVQAEFKDCLKENVEWTYLCLAFFTEDERFCDKTKSPSTCFFSLGWKKALYYNEPSYCDLINKSELSWESGYCKSILSGNLDNCESFGPANKMACIAIITGDISHCNILTNESKQKMCKSRFLLLEDTKLEKPNCGQNVEGNHYCVSYFVEHPRDCVMKGLLPCHEERIKKQVIFDDESDKKIFMELIEEILPN